MQEPDTLALGESRAQTISPVLLISRDITAHQSFKQTGGA